MTDYKEKDISPIVNEIKNLSEEIEKENLKISLEISGGVYIDNKNGFNGWIKYKNNVSKQKFKLNIKPNENFKLKIKLDDNKEILFVYNLIKIGDGYVLTFLKSFGDNKILSDSITIIKGLEISKELNFERTGIGGYQKDIGNLKFNIKVLCE